MKFIWNLITCVLYIEVLVVVLLLLPFIPAQFWSSALRSHFVQKCLIPSTRFYVKVFLCLLFVMMCDACRDLCLMKVANVEVMEACDGLQFESINFLRTLNHFYVSAFSLLCSFIIQRLLTLLNTQTELQRFQTPLRPMAAETLGNMRQSLQKMNQWLKQEQHRKHAIEEQTKSLSQQYEQLTSMDVDLSANIKMSRHGAGDGNYCTKINKNFL